MAGTLSGQKIQGLSTSATPTVVEVSSGHELHTNTLKGTTTAGSIAVQGEGSATTNLQQGLAKMWGVVDQTDSTHVIDDSFNLGTVTDNGTGRTQFNFTNTMNNSTYCVLATKRDGNGYNDEMSVHSDEDGAYDSEKFELVGMNGSSANDADGALWTAVMGDLA